MKDLIGKATLGFLMAQFFPGAVAVFAIGFGFFALEGRFPPTSLLNAADLLLTTWGKATTAHLLFLVGLCVAFGMSIHGIHWATLGMLIGWTRRRSGEGSVFTTPWHGLRLIAQILLGPILIVIETLMLLWSKTISDTSIKDNVSDIDAEMSEQHAFLQEFYLYPAQFFAHTSYALLLVLCSVTVYAFQYGYTGRRIALASVAYLLTGLFYVLARIQLSTLFSAENDLVRRTAGDPAEEDAEASAELETVAESEKSTEAVAS